MVIMVIEFAVKLDPIREKFNPRSKLTNLCNKRKLEEELN